MLSSVSLLSLKVGDLILYPSNTTGKIALRIFMLKFLESVNTKILNRITIRISCCKSRYIFITVIKFSQKFQPILFFTRAENVSIEIFFPKP